MTEFVCLDFEFMARFNVVFPVTTGEINKNSDNRRAIKRNAVTVCMRQTGHERFEIFSPHEAKSTRPCAWKLIYATIRYCARPKTTRRRRRTDRRRTVSPVRVAATSLNTWPTRHDPLFALRNYRYDRNIYTCVYCSPWWALVNIKHNHLGTARTVIT